MMEIKSPNTSPQAVHTPSSVTSSTTPTTTSTLTGLSSLDSNGSPPADGEPPNKKRSIVSRASVAYPRKRAVTACQICRLRKTKCDNERPTCGFCAKVGRFCVYDDSSVDQSKFDPASLAILDRISVAISQLQSISTKLGVKETEPMVWPRTAPLPSSVNSIASISGVDDTYLEADSCSLNIPPGNMTAEKIVKWPIFKDLPYVQGLEPHHFKRPESYDADVLNESYELNYQEAPSLVRSFLVNVHTKNTVCDVATVQQYAREIAEDGPRWDSHTCIVLLLCALGLLAKPIDMKDFGVNSTSITVGANRKDMAKRYFIEARKRIGLINRFSLDLAQCFFLSGQFHMYNLEPDLAWEDFHEACLICKTYLLVNTPGTNNSDDESQNKARASLEQRLFWTCLKSEIELIVELPRPLSGIANVTYPVPFPAPPEDFSSNDGAFPEEEDVIFKDVQEQSWYHYLTEILLRRVSNELINSIYKCDFSEWLKTPLEDLLKLVERWELQIAECYVNLAPKIKFNFEEEPRNEVLVFLSSRFLEMYEYLYRPIVYYAIHRPTSNPDVKKYVDKYFYYCDLKCVKVPNAHRHHGTWYHCRGNYTFALILLAAAKGGIIERTVEELREIVGFFITSLRYWEDESPDLTQPANILERILDDVCRLKQ